MVCDDPNCGNITHNTIGTPPCMFRQLWHNVLPDSHSKLTCIYNSIPSIPLEELCWLLLFNKLVNQSLGQHIYQGVDYNNNTMNLISFCFQKKRRLCPEEAKMSTLSLCTK